MAMLSTQDRAEIATEGMRDSRLGTLTGMTKAQWRAAVDAADPWPDANTASYNAALPQPACGAMTTPEKTLLLVYVISKRFIRGA